MLYWAEGSKDRCRVVFSNSDVDMMRLFMRFLRECHRIPPERITFACNCYLGNGLALEEIERYWQEQLELPDASLRPSIVNRGRPSST